MAAISGVSLSNPFAIGQPSECRLAIDRAIELFAMNQPSECRLAIDRAIERLAIPGFIKSLKETPFQRLRLNNDQKEFGSSRILKF